jgi:hypothetical protein
MKKYILATIAMMMIMIIAGCTSSNGITTAAVAEMPQETVEEEVVQKTPQRMLEEATKGKIVPDGVKYYYVRISEKGVDPQTIVGTMGETVLVDVINTAESDVLFSSTELGVEKVIVPGEALNFGFEPTEEKAYYIHFTGSTLDSDAKLRVVTFEE